MTWDSRYLPPTATPWQGRSDTPAKSAFFQVIKPLDLRQPFKNDNKSIRFALVGFCCDAGIQRNQGRLGAAEGPTAIRAALARLPIQRQDVLCFDAGNITCVDGDLEAAQAALAETVQMLMQHAIVPLVLGGGHEVAWGHFLGIQASNMHQHLGIVNFDAHFDMRKLLDHNKGSSGTPFLQIANAQAQAHLDFNYYCLGAQLASNHTELLETANKKNVRILWADDLHLKQSNIATTFISQAINENETLYVSMCLDVFATPYAPGVSAPQALGLTPWQVIPALRALAASGKVRNYDIAEMSPPFDQDQRTAKLAAHLISEIIHHHRN
jgi:formiminoglutamase